MFWRFVALSYLKQLFFSGKIVMTDYNMKTYRIDDIAWNESPKATFTMRDEQVSYISYYKKVIYINRKNSLSLIAL